MPTISNTKKWLIAGLLLGVFALATAVASIHETVIYSFGGPDGAGPLTGVIADAAGAFYGTTVFGGPDGNGTVFKLTPNGPGYTETVLYNFTGGADGSRPGAGLIADRQGALYGNTDGGGVNGNGTIFQLTPGPSGYTFSLLYSFRGRPDASQPLGTLVYDKQGAIYGVTQFGGSSNQGAVFKLTPGAPGYTESVIHSFSGIADGSLPQAGLTIDEQGSLYGTTYYGGTGGCGGGCGAVFKIAPAGQGYAESILYSFANGNDGQHPFAALTVDAQTGDIYGTTQYGGPSTGGTIFKLTRSGSSYAESVLYGFNCNNNQTGCLPESQLLLRPNGSLFGTVLLGGGGCNGIGCGSVFRLKPSGSGYTFQYIYNFRNPSHGAEPEWTTLIVNNGAIYGTTRSGGSKTQCSDGGPGGVRGCGVLFKLAP